MKQFNNFEKALGILMLAVAILFNLYLYRLEPTALSDPNDNTFQYALVDRTNQIWDFASKKCFGQRPISLWLASPLCHVSLLADHWVPNWAEGYNLPYYYSHVPQIMIVGSYRVFQLFTSQVSLFTYYHFIIYLLLCFFPLSVFVALRVIKLPWLTAGSDWIGAGIGAILASHLSTDGLYGLDPASFLWRGYGLSSQLFAMIWLPLAIAYSWRFINNKQGLFPAIFFLVATTAGHLGIGIMALLSLIPMALAAPLQTLLNCQIVKLSENKQFSNLAIKQLCENLFKVILLGGTVVLILSYWIVPILLSDNYHNISFWDPVWKFNSYGWKETMIRLFNGDLFDFGRFPVLTLLVFAGLFAGISSHNITIQQFNNADAQDGSKKSSYFSFALLFAFWLLLYFGRTTWGPLIDLVPGMKEFHLSRFIVGLHLAGLFLIPIGLEAIARTVSGVMRLGQRPISPWLKGSIKIASYSLTVLLLIVLLIPVYTQTAKYNQLNDTLIVQGNANYRKDQKDLDELFTTLRELMKTKPGRVFAGRGGAWGKNLRIAETPYYMELSTYGIPTVLWLPETWSPNSDTEQYFSEDVPENYALYNIRYVVAPPSEKPKTFWRLIKETSTWKLYEVQTEDLARRSLGEGGYFAPGIRPAIVATDKRSYVNVVRLWIQSDASHGPLFPELTFAKGYPINTGLPNFRMTDEVTYLTPDGKTHNLFAEPPVYIDTNNSTTNKVTIEHESVDADMVFKATVKVPGNCTECLVVLKQSFHPNWKATIDGKSAPTMTVFPFFIGVLAPPGAHDIVVSYEPSGLKIALLVLTLVTIVGGLGFATFTYLAKRRRAG